MVLLHFNSMEVKDCKEHVDEDGKNIMFLVKKLANLYFLFVSVRF